MSGDGNTDPITVDSYTLTLRFLGLSVADLEYFDIGGITDLITEYISQREEHVDNATQEDFDNF